MKTNFLTKFWTIQNDAITVTLSDVIEFLKCNNFGSYYAENNVNNSEPIIIRIENNIVSKLNKTGVIKFCMNCINDSDESDQKKIEIRKEFQELVKSLKTSDLYLIPTVNPKLVMDSIDTAYFFFNNSFVRVNKKHGIQEHDYTQLPGVIFDTQIIPRNFKLEEEEIEAFDDTGFCADQSEFVTFMLDVSKGLPKNYHNNEHENRFFYLEQILGFLIHGYNNPAFSKAIIFYDININGSTEGKTGKTLLTRALIEMKKTQTFDGKQFSLSSSLAFPGIDKATKLIVLDDIKEDFNFKILNNWLTSGITANEEVNDFNYVPFDTRPKLLLTSSRNILSKSTCSNEKTIAFDLSEYYTENPPPDIKFNHLLFDGWNDSQWNQFYNEMIQCVLIYLKHGVDTTIHNVSRKQLVSETSVAFEEFMFRRFYYMPNSKDDRHNKVKIYNKFISEYPKDAYNLSQKRFTKWLRIYADIKGEKYIETFNKSKCYFRFEDIHS